MPPEAILRSSAYFPKATAISHPTILRPLTIRESPSDGSSPGQEADKLGLSASSNERRGRSRLQLVAGAQGGIGHPGGRHGQDEEDAAAERGREDAAPQHPVAQPLHHVDHGV